MIEEERLSDRLRRSQMSVELAVSIARQVGAFLSAYHERGRAYGALDATKVILKNEQHASLEYADERPGATTTDDVHALGHLLFEMATGLPAVGSSSRVRTWCPEAPLELDALVTSMLAVEARPSMAEVARQLAAMPVPPPESPQIAQLRDELQRARASKDFATAMTTLLQLADVDRARPGAWYFAAGELCRDEPGQRDQAHEHFETSLDAYWSTEPSEADVATAMAPFHALDRMLSEAGEWKRLERAHRKMLARTRSFSSVATLRAQLFVKLGEIYRTRLNDESSATAALEEARRLDPSM